MGGFPDRTAEPEQGGCYPLHFAYFVHSRICKLSPKKQTGPAVRSQIHSDATIHACHWVVPKVNFIFIHPTQLGYLRGITGTISHDLSYFESALLW